MKLKQANIIEAATKLFSKHGYHAVGVDRIVEASDVAKMTFYKYFPSKENLIEGVLIKRDQDIRDDIMAAVERCRSPLTKLKAIFVWYENWFETDGFYGCMFIKATEESPDIGAKIKDIAKDHKTWLINLISALLKECSVKSHHELAIHILMILDGLTVRSNLLKKGVRGDVKAAWKYVDIMIKAEAK